MQKLTINAVRLITLILHNALGESFAISVKILEIAAPDGSTLLWTRHNSDSNSIFLINVPY